MDILKLKITKPSVELTKQQIQARYFIQQLIKAAWKEPAFKKQLIQNPIKTIEEVTGQQSRLPKGFQVKVEDQSDSHIVYLNIPPKPRRFLNLKV